MLFLLQSSIRITSNVAPLAQQQRLEDDDDLLVFAWLLFMSRYYRKER